MRYYYKRVRMRVLWDGDRTWLTDADIDRDPVTGEPSNCKWEDFYFPVYNPDLHKH
jgi:hypothetical protein